MPSSFLPVTLFTSTTPLNAETWSEIDTPMNQIAGTDEAGRGPLAGPVVAAAVLLPDDHQLEGLTDSKKLSEARREALFPLIQQQATAWAIAEASVAEIDQLNILQASLLAMRRAIQQIASPEIVGVLVDGNRCPGSKLPERAVIKGDGLVANIAAASVLAKVHRDRLLVELDQQYPDYGFAQHKGYPTRQHVEAINKHGPCHEHRMSFKPLKNLKD